MENNYNYELIDHIPAVLDLIHAHQTMAMVLRILRDEDLKEGEEEPFCKEARELRALYERAQKARFHDAE